MPRRKANPCLRASIAGGDHWPSQPVSRKQNRPPRAVTTPMNRLIPIPLVAALLGLTCSLTAEEGPPVGSPGLLLLNEDFDDLAIWNGWSFDRIDKETHFEVGSERGEGSREGLRISAEDSASGLICRRAFETDPSVRLQWYWSVQQELPKRDPGRKAGDDHAVRVYVIFERPRKEAPWFERLFMRDAPFPESGRLPERTLCYVPSVAPSAKPYPNPYTDRVWTIPISVPPESVGGWMAVEVDPLADYVAAFADEPPGHFRIAIMGDADDTDSASIAWLRSLAVKADPSGSG